MLNHRCWHDPKGATAITRAPLIPPLGQPAALSWNIGGTAEVEAIRVGNSSQRAMPLTIISARWMAAPPRARTQDRIKKTVRLPTRRASALRRLNGSPQFATSAAPIVNPNMAEFAGARARHSGIRHRVWQA